MASRPVPPAFLRDNAQLPLMETPMSVHAELKSWSVPMLAQARTDGRKLVMLTCYDASFGRVLSDAAVSYTHLDVYKRQPVSYGLTVTHD